jgi:uncharacterized membrane protein YesL
MEILVRILFGFFGITLYALLTAKDKDDTSIHSVMDYYKTQYVKWGISFCIVIILAVVLHFAPDVGPAFEAATAIQVTTNIMGFLTLGYNLSSVSKKIGN